MMASGGLLHYMRLTDDARDTLLMGAVVGGGGSVLLLVFELFWRFPWQLIVPLVAGMVVFGVLLGAMSLGDEQRDADRRESSRVSLLAWACLNGGRCETDPTGKGGSCRPARTFAAHYWPWATGRASRWASPAP